MSDKTYLRVLRSGIYASFIILFFVFSDLLFPFISSKQLTFNILIEVLLIVSIFFLINYPHYFPKRSLISGGLIAYFISILFSLFVSCDFNLSFWGDIERMLGFFHLLHFFFFYFIILVAFRSKEDYKVLLHFIIVSAILVALYAIIKNNPDSTIGNRAYVAAMMLFAFFLQVLYLFQSRSWWLRVLYIIGIFFSLWGFVKADISGAQAGLVVGVLVTLFFFTILSKKKNFKIIGFSSLGIFLLLIILLFSFRSHSYFDNSFVGKALRDFSTENITLNTRLISYQSAAQYLIDHPQTLFFGVGHGNYALIFNKYFNPKFYNYDRVGTYFDRAHNNLIDIVTTTGILGLLTYLSIFVFIFIYLKRAYQEKKINSLDLSVLLGLLAAYFVQNLAVFDSFATYLYFLALLAYINFLGSKLGEDKVKSLKRPGLVLYFILPLSLILIIFSLNRNINSFSMIKKTIKAYAYSSSTDIIQGTDHFTEALDARTGLERDARKAFLDLVFSSANVIINSKHNSKAEDTVKLAIDMAEKNLAYNVLDNLSLSRLSRVYDLASRFYFTRGDSDLASYYSGQALETLNLSIESSPGRIPPYLNRANIYLSQGERDLALADIELARNLNSELPEAYCQLAHIFLSENNEENFKENIKPCLELGGQEVINWNDFLAMIESYYLSHDNIEGLIWIYDLVLSFDPIDVNIISKLSLSYSKLLDWEQAKNTAKKLLEIDPVKYRVDVENFLAEIDLKMNN